MKWISQSEWDLLQATKGMSQERIRLLQEERESGKNLCDYITMPKPPVILPSGKLKRVSFVGAEYKLWIDEHNDLFHIHYLNGKVYRDFYATTFPL